MSKKPHHAEIEEKVVIELIAVYAILALMLTGIYYFEPTITGFAVSRGTISGAQTGVSITGSAIGINVTVNINETENIIDNATVENETSNKTKKEEKEKEKPEKAKEPNVPPVWKSDIDEFIMDGVTIIDLNDYFSDKNNDSISYSSSAPDNINVEFNGNLVTLTPAGHNFNSSISFTASDDEKSTTKDVSLIVPERKITINLKYKTGSLYDTDDDGIEETTGIIDLTIENTNFNWEVDESNLCARWETYSIDNQESTTICYGGNRCCQFVDLLATRPTWNEPFFSAFGTYGASFNNIVSSQVLYVDYNLAADEPFSEIYFSNWSDLSASYYFEFYNFKNICVETCLLEDFNESSYKLIFEIENATLELDSLTYTTFETIDKVQVDISIEDNTGSVSGSYELYKDNVLITEEFVEPDYYDIEVIPFDKVIEKLTIFDANITAPLIADIGVDSVSREINIEDVEVMKTYAIDTSELEFENSVLIAIATANNLFKCKQWSFKDEVCFGEWVKIKDLVAGEEYSLSITSDDPGFIEGNLNITIVPVNITELTLIKNISNITINKNTNLSINLNDYFSNIDNDTIFTYFEQENISLVFNNYNAIIIPDKEFIGERLTFITANKSNELAVSNVFKINVINETFVVPEIDVSEKPYGFIGQAGITWNFEISEDTDKEIIVDIIAINDTSFEITLDYHPESVRSNAYRWDMALCDINKTISPKVKHNNKLQNRGLENLNKTLLADSGISSAWCKNNKGYPIVKKANRNIFPQKTILTIPEGTRSFELFAGTGSVLIDANAVATTIIPVGSDNLIRLKNGTLIAAYKGSGNDPFCAVSHDNGATWDTFQIVATTADDVGVTNAPNAGSEDNVMFYWVEADGGDIDGRNSSNACSSFTGTFTIADIAGALEFPSCVYDGGNVVKCISTTTTGVFVYTNSTNFNFERLINNNAADQTDHSSIAVNGSGQEYIFGIGVDGDDLDVWSPALNGYGSANRVEVCPGTTFVKARGSFKCIIKTIYPEDKEYFYCSYIDVRDLQIAYGKVEDIASGTNIQCIELDASSSFHPALGFRRDNLTQILYGNATEKTFTNLSRTNSSGNAYEVRTSLQSAGVEAASIRDSNFPAWNRIGELDYLEFVFENSSGGLHYRNYSLKPLPRPEINGTINNTAPKEGEVINVSFNATSFHGMRNGTIIINQTGVNQYFNFSLPKETISNFSQNFTIACSEGCVINITGLVNNTLHRSSQNDTIITVAGDEDSTLPVVNTTFNITSPVINDVINFSGNVTDETELSTVNITYNISGVITYANYTVSGTSASIHNVTTLTEAGVFNFTMYATDTTNNVKQNSTLITVTDNVVPVVNTTFNITSPLINDVINFSGNVTDETELSTVNITYNISGVITYANYTVSGTEASIHNITTLTEAGVFNFTMYATDTTNNVKQNSTLITVTDNVVPVVNTTFNITSPLINDVINFSGNVTDETELSTVNITYNISGVITYANYTVSGTEASIHNITTLTEAGVFNFTMYATDTSDNVKQNSTLITVTSRTPIIKLNNISIGAIDPIASDSVFVLISFNVTDGDGISNINASKAIVNFTLGYADGQHRANESDDKLGEFGTCFNHTEPGPGSEAARVIINCTVEIRYYDNASSDWKINITVEDIDGNVARNDSGTFTVNELSSFSIIAKDVPGEDANLNFTSLSSGAQNQEAKAPILLNNTGNDDFDQINITGADLESSETSDTILATAFAVNITNSTTAARGLALSTAAQTIPATTSIGGSGGFHPNATLMHGPGISGDTVPYTGPTDTKGNQTLIFWIDVPNGKKSALYNNTWNLTVIKLP